MWDLPKLGVGLGYRLPLHAEIVRNRPQIDFLEVISDQLLYAPGEKLDHLLEAVRGFPLVLHGVGMSIGTAMPLDPDYLQRLACIVKKTGAVWLSDHLSFTKVDDVDLGQLTPLWFTDESARVIGTKLGDLKQCVDTPFLLENISCYFDVPLGEMTEAEFITEIANESDSGLLPPSGVLA